MKPQVNIFLFQLDFLFPATNYNLLFSISPSIMFKTVAVQLF